MAEGYERQLLSGALQSQLTAGSGNRPFDWFKHSMGYVGKNVSLCALNHQKKTVWWCFCVTFPAVINWTVFLFLFLTFFFFFFLHFSGFKLTFPLCTAGHLGNVKHHHDPNTVDATSYHLVTEPKKHKQKLDFFTHSLLLIGYECLLLEQIPGLRKK